MKRQRAQHQLFRAKYSYMERQEQQDISFEEILSLVDQLPVEEKAQLVEKTLPSGFSVVFQNNQISGSGQISAQVIVQTSLSPSLEQILKAIPIMPPGELRQILNAIALRISPSK